MPVIPDKIYNILKWILMIVIPALITFLTTIFTLYGIPHLDIVVGTIGAIATFIGACIGISSKAYYSKKND